jgi:hypothetical protein
MKVIVCRVGVAPVVEDIDPGLEAMQAIVQGYIERVVLGGEPVMGHSVDLWLNEEGRIQGLRANRLVVSPFNGEVLVHGDFFIAAGDPEGETIGLSDEQIAEWLGVVASWRTFEVYGGRN